MPAIGKIPPLNQVFLTVRKVFFLPNALMIGIRVKGGADKHFLVFSGGKSIQILTQPNAT